jgi:hypothetical protein
MRINPSNNSIKLQQQQILLKYKIRQNEITTNKQPEAVVTNNKQNMSNGDSSSKTSNNSQKLAVIKSKIRTEYANLYSSK